MSNSNVYLCSFLHANVYSGVLCRNCVCTMQSGELPGCYVETDTAILTRFHRTLESKSDGASQVTE